MNVGRDAGVDAGAVAYLRDLLVDGRGVAEPKAVAAALGEVPANCRDLPICRLADAVIGRTGDLEVSDVLHRAAAQALADDPPALTVVLSSWVGGALARRDAAMLEEIAGWGSLLDERGEHDAARAVLITISAAVAYASGDFAGADHSLADLVTGRVPVQLRGSIAWVRALALQARGMIETATAVLDADQAHLGVFDLSAELARARGVWVGGAHDRARAMVMAVHVRATQLGRPHDANFAAALERVLARLDGDEPVLPPPTPVEQPLAEMVRIERALARLPDEQAAARELGDIPEYRVVAPELLAVRFVLCPHHRDAVERRAAGVVDPSGSLDAARALIQVRSGTAASVEPWQVRSLPAPWRRELSAPRQRPAADQIALRVLGHVVLVHAGREMPIGRERVRALFAALAVHRKLSRERLMAMLWPDMPSDGAANNLRVTLSYTRRAVSATGAHPDSVVVANRSSVSIECDVDLWEFDRATTLAKSGAGRGTEVGEWARAASVAAGGFAPDISGAEWLDVARRSIDAAVVEALWQAARRWSSGADPERRQAATWANRAIEIDPWSEPAWEALVACRLAEDGEAGAREVAQQATLRLSEIGVRPSGLIAPLVGD